MADIQAAAPWSGLLILLLTVLGVRVTLHRRKHKVLLGDGGVSELTVSGRVFSNAAEYIPASVAALILLALCGFQDWIVHALGAALLAGRLIHPFGMKSTGGVTAARAGGMVLTWTPLLIAGLLLVLCPWLG
jgi:uncharacterized protein